MRVCPCMFIHDAYFLRSAANSQLSERRITILNQSQLSVKYSHMNVLLYRGIQLIEYLLIWFTDTGSNLGTINFLTFLIFMSSL